MKENIRKELSIIAMIMLITANAANGGLSIFSFQKLYVNSLISGYKAVAKDLLNTAGGFEKPPEKSVSINRMEMRRIYFIFLNFRIRMYGKICTMIRENGIRKADDKKIHGVSVMSQTASDV